MKKAWLRREVLSFGPSRDEMGVLHARAAVISRATAAGFDWRIGAVTGVWSSNGVRYDLILSGPDESFAALDYSPARIDRLERIWDWDPRTRKGYVGPDERAA